MYTSESVIAATLPKQLVTDIAVANLGEKFPRSALERLTSRGEKFAFSGRKF
jgi:hypothetical protein